MIAADQMGYQIFYGVIKNNSVLGFPGVGLETVGLMYSVYFAPNNCPVLIY